MSGKPNEVEQALLTAASNLIEYRDDTGASMTTSGPNESTTLCVVVTLVSSGYAPEAMGVIGKALEFIKMRSPKLVSTRPEKPH